MNRRLRFLALALLALAGSSPLLAHDFWIEPSSFRPEVKSTVSARLMVGQNFQGEPLPRNPALILKFFLASAAGEDPLAGRSGDEPAGTVTISSPGLQALAYRSGNSAVSLEPQKFEDYLREEGLERIVAERARRGDSQKPSRELFSRCAKALLFAGPLGPTGEDRELGLTLELRAEKNPYGLRAGSELPVRLLYEGKPLVGALVTAVPYGRAQDKLSQRTDRNGRVRLHLPYGGVWLVKAVHMVAAPADSGADWQSLWASLTFEIPTALTIGNTP
ncbi:MAG TPA: DUF4198 domain-containing protein [Thermoanaerobaculia bacterium]